MEYKRINNNFQWGDKSFLLTFSNPKMTSFEEQKIYKTEDIMYFYYDVNLFTAKQKYNNETKEFEYDKYKLLISYKIYDFPSVLQLQKILNYMIPLNLKTLTTAQNDSDEENQSYQYNSSTNQWLHEDYYSLTKFSTNFYETYCLFIGCSNEGQGSVNLIGCRLTELNENEIIQLKQCIDDFIQYGINEHNKDYKA